MQNKFYKDIFRHSGRSYHRAMEREPTARDEEFIAAVKLLDLLDGSTVLDVPAGGGYLQNYLSYHTSYIARDFSVGFSESETVRHCTESNLLVPRNSIDNIVCLAALHHIEDQPGFFKASYNALKNKGQFLIGDVVEGSRQDIFLNQFVDRWNSLGHKGHFINEKKLKTELNRIGFEVSYSIKEFTWNFANRQQARQFVRSLFNLDNNPSDKKLDCALDELGISESQSSFHINWALGFFKANKNKI